MTPSPFLTQIQPYRNPKALWPLAASASVLAHGVLLLGFRPLLIATQIPELSDSAIPIQLVAAPNSIPANLEAAQPANSAPPTNAAPIDSAEPNLPAQPNAALPSSPSPEPVVQPPPASPTSALPLPEPDLAQPAPAVLPLPGDLSAPSSPPPSVTAPPSDVTTLEEFSPPAPSPVSPPIAASSGGQLTPVSIQPAAYGRDFPDTPPQLLSNSSLSVQPWLSVCGWQNPGAMVSPGLSATVQLQLHVQPSGEISFARVARSSGNLAVDELVSCVVQRQLRLKPAMLAGDPFFTDAYLLDTQVQF